MKKALLILPNQLFKDHPRIDTGILVLLLEHPRFFTAQKFHKQKLIFHRTSMQEYAKQLQNKKIKLIYAECKPVKKFYAACLSALKKDGIEEVEIVDPVDHVLEKELNSFCKKNKLKLSFYDSPQFLLTTQDCADYFSDKKQFRMAHFYSAQRIRLNVLVTKNKKPIGGSWSFDDKNRKPLPKDMHIPQLALPPKHPAIKKATQYVEKKFGTHPGLTESFIYPITHADAQKWLNDFLIQRLKDFGAYQDAFVQTDTILFHSLLSPLLNSGLLTPQEVLDKTLAYAKKHSTPLNSLEGFIRQLIGWREFIRGMYAMHGKEEQDSNFFKHTRPLPKSFWHGTTGILPVDTVIKKVLATSYAHHIERLMILGNFMLLCEFDPKDVYAWFMELFIDAYEWVMVPNVYGMSQFADGGLFASKPYISSSAYLHRMGNYPHGEWEKIWDALYWRFIFTHATQLKKQPRLAIMVSYLKRMKKDTLQKHLSVAEKFLKDL